ncbi:MAG TPA: alpha/beta hydrolase [Candidatus Saccharimonadales bacterium]|nr:alpha/beta hydrolase [Candidatus Saccharimonadales bacterium]
MPKKEPPGPDDFIVPLNMNGLEGRMLKLPAKQKNKSEILFIYGQHSSLERWWGLGQVFNQYGAVTMPDLPGFGGMTSLYKIGKDASVDNLADYLAAFFKLKYRRKRVTIAGMSLGFVVVTRMLQKYPELTKNIDGLIAIVGFAHHDDFIFSRGRARFYRMVSAFFARKWPAAFFQGIFLQPFYLRRAYKHSRFAKEKLSKLSGDEFKRTMDMEIQLWRINDLRTQMKTNNEMFKLDNTKILIDLPVWHVASKKDRYFNNARAEEHLRQIFKDYQIMYTKDPNHAPTIIADVKAAAPFVPPELRRLLRKKRR